MSIYDRIKKKYKLHVCQKKWRKLNTHNNTWLIKDTDISKVVVGENSYGPLNIHSWNAENEGLIIGNYVSISAGVQFILGGNHKYDSFSTFPFKVKFFGEKEEAYSNGRIVINDDVWIGMNSMVMSGVTIGKGAVIAAGSVVTKDVPNYAIVGGNPAKIIKYRFNDSIIERIEDIELKKINIELIRDNIDLFYATLNCENVEKIRMILDNK